jgi:hypothetical protein
MSARRIIWNVTIVVGILLAAELGFLLFLGENLIAIFLGIPQIIVMGGILWLTHGLLAGHRLSASAINPRTAARAKRSSAG